MNSVIDNKISGRVDCICITEDRTAFLPGSIKCFQNQNYPDKHLYIFYTSGDENTRKFVLKNKQYNNVLLEYKFEKTNEFIIESVADSNKPFSEFGENEIFFLRTSSGEYMKAFQDNSIGLSHFEVEKDLQFVLKKNNNNTVSIYTAYDQWLSAEKNGILGQTEVCSDWETFRITSEKNDTKIVLSSWNEFALAKATPVKIDDQFSWKATVVHETDSEITFVEINKNAPISLGEKRNIASRYAKGKYICVWDDDDWHNPNRISKQVEATIQSGKGGCTLGSIYIYNKLNSNVYVSGNREEGWEGTLLCKAEYMGKYEHLAAKEDTVVLHKLLHENNIYILNMPYLYIYLIHTNNTSDSTHFNEIIREANRVAPNEDHFIKECFA